MSLLPIVTRRSALLAAAAAPLAVNFASSSTAFAAGHAKGKANAPFAHFKLGDFIITTLLVGVRDGTEPQKTFGMNASKEEFTKASEENLIPADSFRTFFTPTIVDTGSDVVLFDAGLGGDQPAIIRALESAGYATSDITKVVITHMHPDHIGGLMTGGKPTFANAEYITGASEYEFWITDGAESRVGQMVETLVKPLAERMSFFKGGDSVVSGVTAMEAFGHTPGHMTYMLESNGQQLLLAADLANHYVWSLAYPDWEVRFDFDKPAAAASRRKILGMLAADKIPFVGYHMPFPAVGYVTMRGNGFYYIPETYQLAL